MADVVSSLRETGQERISLRGGATCSGSTTCGLRRCKRLKRRTSMYPLSMGSYTEILLPLLPLVLVSILTWVIHFEDISFFQMRDGIPSLARPLSCKDGLCSHRRPHLWP